MANKKDLQFTYLGLQEYPVADKMNFFQTGLKELAAARGLLTAGRRLFKVPDNNIRLYLIGEDSVGVKIEFYIGSGASMSLLCKIYYLPKEQRVDVYDNSFCLAAFERKKLVFSNCSEVLVRLGYEKLFGHLISAT